MARQSKAQRRTIGRVMHERKHGQLKMGRGRRKVKSRRQAIAIALREAGASKYQRGGERKSSLRRTKRRERTGRTGRSAARRPARSRTRKTTRSRKTRRAQAA
jgi:hypothetical protein